MVALILLVIAIILELGCLGLLVLSWRWIHRKQQAVFDLREELVNRGMFATSFLKIGNLFLSSVLNSMVLKRLIPWWVRLLIKGAYYIHRVKKPVT